MPNGLFIETSFQGWSICYRVDGKVSEKISNETLLHSDADLFQALQHLSTQDVNFWTKIENVGCTIGPGRFNAVRLGISVMGTIMAIYPNLNYWTCSAFEILMNNDLNQNVEGYAIFAKKGYCYYLPAGADLHTASLKPYSECEGKVIHSLKHSDYPTVIMTDKIQACDILKMFDANKMKKLETFSDIEPLYAALL